MTWQIHVYGIAKPELANWCADKKVGLRIFAWTGQYEAAGLARNAFVPIEAGHLCGARRRHRFPERC
jgi:hypothetical protein